MTEKSKAERVRHYAISQFELCLACRTVKVVRLNVFVLIITINCLI